MAVDAIDAIVTPARIHKIRTSVLLRKFLSCDEDGTYPSQLVHLVHHVPLYGVPVSTMDRGG